ncbi:hypothetical protein WUBG_14607, partial [Wuchereria bancrofti]
SYEPSNSICRRSLIDRKSNKSSSKRSVSTVEVHHQYTTSSSGSVHIESTEIAEHIAPSLRYIRKCNRDK